MDAREDTVGDYEDEGARGWSFRDRKDAGQQLARALSEYRGQEALVLGIPRGGVPVAYEIACSLDAELDVIVARKIGAPGQEEFGIGAIAADGTLVINEDMRAYVHISEPELEQRTQEQSAEAQRREHRFRVGLPALSPAGRLVIVVDDGLATGATLRAAVRSLQRRGAERLVVAVPVGAPEACTRIAREVDRLICLQQPEPFCAVGRHYREFDQSSDEEVQQLLRQRREAKKRS